MKLRALLGNVVFGTQLKIFDADTQHQLFFGSFGRSTNIDGLFIGLNDYIVSSVSVDCPVGALLIEVFPERNSKKTEA